MSRVCSQCGMPLNQYNPGKLCFPCQKKKQEELTEKTGDSPNYDVNELSYMLGLRNEQVRRLGREQKIPGKIPGIRRHLYIREIVDQWIHSGGKITKPELLEHYSELAISTLKLVEILEYYYKAHITDIEPLISTAFPLTSHLPDSPTLSGREFSNLMDHLKGEIPELASISEYPSACKRYFTGNNKAKMKTPTATITGDLILKLKLIASQGQFPGRCPDCPS
jgi:hypothetical protein